MKTFQKIQFIFLFCIYCTIYPSGGVPHGMQCGGYFRRSKIKINGDNFGYCWWFRNNRYTAEKAFNQCKVYRARKPAVTTSGKARKLSAFMKEILHISNGAKVNEIWVSDINEGRWKSTQAEVTDAATTEGSIKKHGNQCVAYNPMTAKWRYASCSEIHPTICEDENIVYPDDVGADDWTTPSVTLPPTPPHRKGLKLTCPEGYDEFEKHCFYISKKREMVVDAEKRCNYAGGYLVWISDSSKNSLVQRYVRANKDKFPPFFGVWLARLEGNGYIIKWKGPGTNARYILNKNKMSRLKDLKKGIMPMLYMNRKGDIFRTGNRRGIKAAFCESTRIVAGSRKFRRTTTMAAVPTKPPKTIPYIGKHIPRKYKPTKSNPPITGKHHPKTYMPTNSKPVNGKNHHKMYKPTISEPVSGKHHHNKHKPTNSKPVNGKNHPNMHKPTNSKPVNGEHLHKMYKPTKSEPNYEDRNHRMHKPTTSKPVHKKHNPTKSYLPNSRSNDREDYPAETTLMTLKTTDKTKPMTLEATNDSTDEMKPMTLEAMDVSTDETKPMALETTDVQVNDNFNKEGNVPQDVEGDTTTQTKGYLEETEVKVIDQETLDLENRSPLGPLASCSTSSVYLSGYQLVLLYAALVFTIRTVFSVSE